MGGGEVSLKNLGIGAALHIFEVSTLGQPFEVLKTHMAANRGDGLKDAFLKTFKRGGIAGFYQGLIPWAWIEAATKGGVLLFVSSAIEKDASSLFNSSAVGGVVGGMAGGIGQAYTTMGICTFMKTVEVTRNKSGANMSTMQIANQIWKKEGIWGLNKGVTAVALRQMTNWGSRFGISRLTETLMKGSDSSRKLSQGEKILASAIGGALACWNQPIEVIRVEMQSQIKSPNRPQKPNIFNTGMFIYQENGIKGLFRGVLPRIGLSMYVTICMVYGGDVLKNLFQDNPE